VIPPINSQRTARRLKWIASHFHNSKKALPADQGQDHPWRKIPHKCPILPAMAKKSSPDNLLFPPSTKTSITWLRLRFCEFCVLLRTRKPLSRPKPSNTGMLSPKAIDTLKCEKMSFRVFAEAAGLPCYSLYGGTRHSFAAMCRLI
jgi:hypothetical protein